MVRARLTRAGWARLAVALGSAIVSVGVGLIYVPAGVIAAGLAVVLIGLYLIDVEGVLEPRTARPRRPPL